MRPGVCHLDDDSWSRNILHSFFCLPVLEKRGIRNSLFGDAGPGICRRHCALTALRLYRREIRFRALESRLDFRRSDPGLLYLDSVHFPLPLRWENVVLVSFAPDRHRAATFFLRRADSFHYLYSLQREDLEALFLGSDRSGNGLPSPRYRCCFYWMDPCWLSP